MTKNTNQNKYLTIGEINSNPIYNPLPQFIDEENKISNMIKDFFNNPVLLKSRKSTYIQRGLGVKKNPNFLYEEIMLIDNTQKEEYFRFDREYPIHLLPFKKYGSHINSLIMKLESEKEDNDLYKTNYEIFITKDIHYKNKNFVEAQLGYKIITTFKKGQKLSELEKEGMHRKYNNYIDAFNIIEKEFKCMQETNKDSYKKTYYHTRPFEQFEETGIEVLFVNSGFQSNGRRKPNFNRGAVSNLKNTCKMNKIKGYSRMNKNDLIKILIKL